MFMKCVFIIINMVSSKIKCVFIIINMVSSKIKCVEINLVGLTSIRCTQSTLPGGAHIIGIL